MALPGFHPTTIHPLVIRPKEEARLSREPGFEDGNSHRRRGNLAFMFALIERLSLGEIATRVLHEVSLGLLAAKAVGMASVRRIDSAIRLNVLLIGKTPGTLIAEFASHRISRGGKSKHECKRK